VSTLTANGDDESLPRPIGLVDKVIGLPEQRRPDRAILNEGHAAGSKSRIRIRAGDDHVEAANPLAVQ
jgi:hypothetical protein